MGSSLVVLPLILTWPSTDPAALHLAANTTTTGCRIGALCVADESTLCLRHRRTRRRLLMYCAVLQNRASRSRESQSTMLLDCPNSRRCTCRASDCGHSAFVCSVDEEA
ncbi:uncharacterized protein P884DRAFT_39898 [Thermothelomyces heterothallicus CBS 202.75]|uniref:uncharacterized protein n=1 Tax=Thermothelomyces heterothallicus CBS 202.75 TaxID=1149848 RepID=UPI003742C577